MLEKLKIEPDFKSFFKGKGFIIEGVPSLVPHIELGKIVPYGGLNISLTINKLSLQMDEDGFSYKEMSTFDIEVDCRVIEKKLILVVPVFENVPVNISDMNYEPIQRSLSFLDKVAKSGLSELFVGFADEGYDWDTVSVSTGD